MKTPISYYGGKQNLISELLPLIPPHTQYVEPFVGGASLFFAKKPSDCEVINDYDLRVANFWEVLQTDFETLQVKIKNTFYSEFEHKKAKKILLAEMGDKIDFAWAFWVRTQMSFSHDMMQGFAFGNSPDRIGIVNKREGFNKIFYNRLRKTQIFNRDALDLIGVKDHKNTFIYLDPPYAESNCGHYEDGKDVYYRLLDILPTLKSKWLMSSYQSQQLTDLRLKYGWNHKDIDKNLSVSGKDNAGKRKTECLTWNYNLENQQRSLFAA